MRLQVKCCVGRRGFCFKALDGGYPKKGPDILFHLYNVIITTLKATNINDTFLDVSMTWNKLTETPCRFVIKRDGSRSHINTQKKKLLAVCGMMTFDPKYSFESPFANIWENNLFDSDCLSFDLIKKNI